jgi:hypothetical protein
MNFKVVSDHNRNVCLNMTAIQAYASRYKPGTSFDVEFVRRVPKKVASPEQRGYYYAEVLPKLMLACGYDPEESSMVHRQLKIIFFHVQPDKRGIYRDKEIPSVFSLESDIGVEKRCQFIDWVARKAAENGEYVNPPKGKC